MPRNSTVWKIGTLKRLSLVQPTHTDRLNIRNFVEVTRRTSACPGPAAGRYRHHPRRVLRLHSRAKRPNQEADARDRITRSYATNGFDHPAGACPWWHTRGQRPAGCTGLADTLEG